MLLHKAVVAKPINAIKMIRHGRKVNDVFKIRVKRNKILEKKRGTEYHLLKEQYVIGNIFL